MNRKSVFFAVGALILAIGSFAAGTKNKKAAAQGVYVSLAGGGTLTISSTGLAHFSRVGTNQAQIRTTAGGFLNVWTNAGKSVVAYFIP